MVIEWQTDRLKDKGVPDEERGDTEGVVSP